MSTSTPAPGATRGATALAEPAHPRHQDGAGADINVNVPPQRADQVRWGPVWAGLVVALPTFLLGELLFLALGVLDVGNSVTGGTAGVVTGLIALAAFFLGGLTAAATAMWRGTDAGLLHGILVWALGVIALLLLTIVGAGSLLGSAGNIASQLTDPATLASAAGQAASNAPDISTPEAIAAGKSAASWGVLGLGLTFIASALGGVAGAKFWPRKKDTETSSTRTA